MIVKKENAIIMAAGLGSRMAELTTKTAKPLVKVFGTAMIETMIEGLLTRGVTEIYIVTGCKKEQFAYLQKKYGNVSLLENVEYASKNNISSIYAAREILRMGNCFICEGDIFLRDKSILMADLTHSCYYGKMVEGYSSDWVFDMDREGKRIVRVGKGGNDTYNMVGIAYFSENDAKLLADAIEMAYQKPGHEDLFWDDVVNNNLDVLEMTIFPVTDKQLAEIDTISELKEIDPDYLKYN